MTDFCWVGAGSYTTKLLSDFGADVIKIESSTHLDQVRNAPPFKDGIPGINRSGYFADRNTNKRSITINVKHAQGKTLAKRLIAQSDIVTNNFRAGTMEKLGLGYREVERLKPGIIYVAISMAGSEGPERDTVGFGSTIAAYAGLQHLSGLPNRPPAGTGTHYPDHVPNPCHAAFAILAALRHRRRTGEGQCIDIAQIEPTIALIGPAILDYVVNRKVRDRIGNEHPQAAPHGVYPCRGDDRWIAIAVINDQRWVDLLRALGSPEWARPEWLLASRRHADRGKIDELLAGETADRDPDTLMTELQSRGVPSGIVQTAADVVSRDPQLAYRKHWARLHHSEMGETLYNNPPFRMSQTPVELERGAPLLGEHTDEVCKELLGLDDEEIAALVSAGVLV